MAGLRAKYGLPSIALDGSQPMLQDGPGLDMHCILSHSEQEGTSAAASPSREAAPGRAGAEAVRIPALIAGLQSISVNSAGAGSREDGSSDDDRAAQRPEAYRADAAARVSQRKVAGHQQGHATEAPSETGSSEAELRQGTNSSAACSVDDSRGAAGRGPGRDGLPDLDWRQLGQMLCDCGFPALPSHVRRPSCCDPADVI